MKVKPFPIRGEYGGVGSGSFTDDKGKSVPYWNFTLLVMGGTYKFKQRNVAEAVQAKLPLKAGGTVDVIVEIRPDKEGEPVLYVLDVVPVENPAPTQAPGREMAGAGRQG